MAFDIPFTFFAKIIQITTGTIKVIIRVNIIPVIADADTIKTPFPSLPRFSD
jgi:hypothetical protein